MTSRLETRLTLRPGQPVPRKLQARFGERLVVVRYRYDLDRGQRIKTVELVIESRPWEPVKRNERRAAGDIVQVRLHWNEAHSARPRHRAGRALVPRPEALGNDLVRRPQAGPRRPRRRLPAQPACRGRCRVWPGIRKILTPIYI